MPVKQIITSRNYLLHPFHNIPICKRFTQTSGTMQFSIIFGHTVSLETNSMLFEAFAADCRGLNVRPTGHMAPNDIALTSV